MESLGYILVYFLRGSLPWQGLKAGSDSRKEELILEKKKATTVIDLCSGLPRELFDYFHYLSSTRSHDRPSYRYLRMIFSNLFRRQGFEYDNVFDWTILKFFMEKNQGKRGTGKTKAPMLEQLTRH